ncbi:hypothetical protein [Nostoc favosum]|uniref:hypothetical protein n=1 Tax=Nostoc favosum TaxID=2907819 RepID=UPI002795CA61|nr:hypothetical protein [Nostoc favosum]
MIHAAFWLALIFAYPKFPQVQAIFFWNRWVIPIHENPDTYRFLVGAWQCHALTSVLESVEKKIVSVLPPSRINAQFT